MYMCVCWMFNLSLLVGGPMVIKPMAKVSSHSTFTPSQCGQRDFQN